MTKADLINALAEDTELSKKDSETFLNSFMAQITKGGCKSLTQVGYLFYVLQNFQRAIKFQTTSWSII
jgi:hypothetical protein